MEYKFKTDPYEHQLSALNSCKFKTNWALFMDMGTGKTKTTIDNLPKHKYTAEQIQEISTGLKTQFQKLYNGEYEHKNDEVKEQTISPTPPNG